MHCRRESKKYKAQAPPRENLCTTQVRRVARTGAHRWRLAKEIETAIAIQKEQNRSTTALPPRAKAKKPQSKSEQEKCRKSRGSILERPLPQSAQKHNFVSRETLIFCHRVGFRDPKLTFCISGVLKECKGK